MAPGSLTPAGAARNGAVLQSMGQRLRDLRRRHGWTLEELSERTGLAISTISKAERGLVALGYDRFIALAHGMGIDVGELFSPEGDAFEPGCVATSSAAQATVHETDTYIYRMLFPTVRGKQMLPMIGQIKAHSIASFPSLISHDGEEFVYVLSGVLDLFVDGRNPTRLAQGECAYFDSSRGHAYVSAGEGDAQILVVCFGHKGEERPTA